MIAKTMAGACVAVAAVLQLLAAPTPAEARDCEARKGDSEIRCLSFGAMAMDGETVVLKNVSAAAVTFYVQEWYSHCGVDADEEPSLEKIYQLAPGDSGRLAVMPSPKSTAPDPCTEFFVYGCASNGRGVDCHKSLHADISPGKTLVAPPLRRSCEPWKGGKEIRCVGSGGVAESLAIRSRSSADIWFSVQEWYSACQLSANGPPSAIAVEHLSAKQSLEHSVGFTWPSRDWPAAQSQCTEIFIFKCRDATKFTNCADNLLATVGQ